MTEVGSIEAILSLNATGFTEGLSTATTALNKFANATTKLNGSKPATAMEQLDDALIRLESSLQMVGSVSEKNLKTFSRLSTAVKNMANGLNILQSDTLNVETAVNTMNNIFKQFENVLNGTEIKIKGVVNSVRSLTNAENQNASATERVKAVFTGLSTAINPAKMSLIDYGKIERETYLEGKRQEENLRILQREFKALALGVEQFNAIETGTVAKQREVANATNQVTNSMERQSVASNRATTSTTRQASATRGLGKALSSLRMMGGLVASMFAYNFAHKLLMATSETVHAKSEMEGYFKMLHFSQSDVRGFNETLDETIQQFQRVNKYALGETISSIGVEFKLSTKEMEKAMKVTSMITSEYLRAGRNANEASLAVKDVLQGQFQRLSRETGVKGKNLKDAGWSGDTNDVLGLMKALEKVAESRNWDTFAEKANSLNDIITITQNRFGEWSADMVYKVQPMIINSFNAMMNVASIFGDMLGGAMDWLSGDGIGQGIVKWGGLATAITLGYTALVRYRTGANLTQIAQMGLSKSITASILGLEAESVATYGTRTALISRLTGIEAETVANEGRFASIMSVVSGLEAEEVAQIGASKVLVGSIFGVDMAILKQYGLATAVGVATTGIEAETFASKGLLTQLGLIAGATLPAIAVVGAFAVAFGQLVMKTMDATEKMSNFYDIQKNSEQIMNDSRATVKNLKDDLNSLKETQKKYAKGSKEYENVGKAIDSLNSKIELANSNINSNYEAVQRVNDAQKRFDTTKQEAQLELQQRINQSLVDTGLSVEEANELSNTYLNEAIDGSNQLYDALQSVVNQYDKEASGVASLSEYWQNQGLDAESVKLKVDPYIDAQNELTADIEKMKVATNILEVATAWLEIQYDQIKLSLSENLPKIEAGDVVGGITGLLKGLAHGLYELPIFHDFWSYVFDHFNIEETYGGKGEQGLVQWIYDSFGAILNGNPISKFFVDTFKLGWNVGEVITGFTNVIQTSLSNFDLFGEIWKAITGGGDSSNSNSSGGATSTGGIAKKINISNLLPDIDISGVTSWANDHIINPVKNTFDNFDFSGIVSKFTQGGQGIINTAKGTVSNVSTKYGEMKDRIKSTLSGIVNNNGLQFDNIKTKTESSLNYIRGVTSNITSKMVGAWTTMKDSILGAAKKIYDGVKSKFDSVKTTIGNFYHKLTNPSEWFSGAGLQSYSRSPKPNTARKLFSPVKRTGVHGAGVNPYQSSDKKVTLDELVSKLGGSKKVNLNDFLSLFADSGFGGWNFAKKHKTTIFNEGKKWDAKSPSLNGVTLGDGFPVKRFWDGKAQGFKWQEFMSVATALFSAIPYKFYMDSDWKGDWVSALLSGATNCSDGSDALIALASLFGFSGEKVHTNLKGGMGHFFAVINGKKMDTTNFQHNGSWKPLGGAGIPTRSGNTGYNGYKHEKTVNVNLDMSNSTIYGVDDLDERIADGVDKGLQSHFNDPYTVAI